MKVTGIIVEYNPFHNGHVYHIQKSKASTKCDLLVAVMSGNYTQRGDIAIIDKFDRTKLALEHGVDVVIELPYFYSTASADLFAYGAITLLKHLQVDDLVFGSESNDLKQLESIATLIDTEAFDVKIKEYLDEGAAYPNASMRAISDLTNQDETVLSNDILGIQYIRSIHKLDASIKYHSIQRVNNNYRDKELSLGDIASATSIREAVKANRDISQYVPALTKTYLDQPQTWEAYYQYLRYQIIASESSLEGIHDMNEGFHNSIFKNSKDYTTFNDFINSLTSKRYTESKVKRMLCHILTQFTKTEFQSIDKNYIRVLGLNKSKTHLFKKLTEKCEIPIITNVTKHNRHFLELELRTDAIYYLMTTKKTRMIPLFVQE